MANWAITSYVIEGPKSTLKKIMKAILNHEVEEGSSDNWEGNVLKALGLEWEKPRVEQEGNEIKFYGNYMRGFILDIPHYDEEEGTLRFDAEEAWGLTDFYKILEKGFLDIRIYWVVEEPGDGVYATNDKEGKYFPDRYHIDTCIDGAYENEYFTTEENMWDWLSKRDATLTSMEAVEKWVEQHEELCDEDENFIFIHKFDVME